MFFSSIQHKGQMHKWEERSTKQVVKKYAWCFSCPCQHTFHRHQFEPEHLWYLDTSAEQLLSLQPKCLSRLCLSLFLLFSLKPSEIDSSQLLPVVRNPLASDLMSNYPLVARDKFFRSRINAL